MELEITKQAKAMREKMKEMSPLAERTLEATWI
jgi:hypothetical protein